MRVTDEQRTTLRHEYRRARHLDLDTDRFYSHWLERLVIELRALLKERLYRSAGAGD